MNTRELISRLEKMVEGLKKLPSDAEINTYSDTYFMNRDLGCCDNFMMIDREIFISLDYPIKEYEVNVWSNGNLQADSKIFYSYEDAMYYYDEAIDLIFTDSANIVSRRFKLGAEESDCMDEELIESYDKEADDNE